MVKAKSMLRTLSYVSVLLLLGSLGLSACKFLTSEESSESDFYSYSKDGDLYRIPLFEPYEIINTGYLEESWFLDLPFGELGTDQIHLEKIGTSKEDSVFVTYSNRIYFDNDMRELWVVVDIPKQEEIAFTDETRFLKSPFGKIQLYPCEDIFTHFEQKGEWLHLK
jgi:hypothetical protein